MEPPRAEPRKAAAEAALPENVSPSLVVVHAAQRKANEVDRPFHGVRQEIGIERDVTGMVEMAQPS